MSRRPPIFVGRFVNIGDAVTFEAPKFTDIQISGWIIEGKLVTKRGEYVVRDWSTERIAQYRRDQRIARRFSWLPSWLKHWLDIPINLSDFTLSVTNNAVLP